MLILVGLIFDNLVILYDEKQEAYLTDGKFIISLFSKRIGLYRVRKRHIFIKCI